jgi:hypothetical protein
MQPSYEWYVLLHEFNQGQNIDPIILMLIDRRSKVLFQYLIHALGLSIYLRMIGWRKIDLNP